MFIIYLWQSCYCFLCSCFCTHVIFFCSWLVQAGQVLEDGCYIYSDKATQKDPIAHCQGWSDPGQIQQCENSVTKESHFCFFFFLLYVLPFGNCAQMLCGATQPVTCIYPNLSCWLTCITQTEGEGELRSERWLLAKVISAFRVVNWRNIQGLVFSVILVEGCYEHTCKCSFPSEFVKKEGFFFFFCLIFVLS